MKTLGNAKEGISVNGVIVDGLKYTDDTLRLADTVENVQKMSH